MINQIYLASRTSQNVSQRSGNYWNTNCKCCTPTFPSVGNRPVPDVRFRSATWRWKDLNEGYNFGSDLVAIQLCSQELWRFNVPRVLLGQFRDSISGVPGICAIWMPPPWRAAENTIGSKVVAYSRVQAAVNLACPSARGKSQHQRVSRMLN